MGFILLIFCIFHRFIENELIEKSVADKTHIFSTYFISKMMPVPIDSGFPLEREEFANKIDQKYKEIMTVILFFFSKNNLNF